MGCPANPGFQNPRIAFPINAATRMNGLSYSKFMNGIKLAGVDINRKMLSEIAINDAKAFADLVELAKKNLNA